MMIPQANGLRNRWGRGENWPVYRHSLSKLAPALHCLIQTTGQIGILLIVAFLGKGIFLFVQKPLGVILIEACPLLGNAVEPQIEACDKGILLVADVFLALAAPELVQQFVVSRYDLSRRLREVSFQSCHPRKEPLPRR